MARRIPTKELSLNQPGFFIYSRRLTLVGLYKAITSESFAIVGRAGAPFDGFPGTIPLPPMGESMAMGVMDMVLESDPHGSSLT